MGELCVRQVCNKSFFFIQFSGFTLLVSFHFIGIRSLPSCWMQWPLEALDPYLHAGSEQDDKTLPKSASAEKDSECKMGYLTP